MWRKLIDIFRAILMLDDTPHSIALGTAIGLFIAWTPTVGIHMILVVAFTFALRANRLAALIAVYVSNPVTIIPMYWLEYKLGAFSLDQQLTYNDFVENLGDHSWAGLWHAFRWLCVDLAGPMWLGGLALGLANAVPGFFATRWAVVRFRRTWRDRGHSATSTPVATSATSPKSRDE